LTAKRIATPIFAAVALTLAVVAVCPSARAGDRDPHLDIPALGKRLAALVERHPGKARLVTVATSPRGLPMRAIEIDLDGHFAPAAPTLLVHGGVHGDEWLGVELVLRLAEVLLGTDDPAWHGLEYHLVPAVNVDGFALGERLAFGISGKRYDMNRVFPVPGRPDTPSSEPLLQAFRDYGRRPGLAAVLDYHTDADCILWPWAHSADTPPPPDVEWTSASARAMARAIGACAGQVARVISYRHQGTAQDWFQGFALVPAILVEMSGTQRPAQPAVEQVLLDHEHAFRVFVARLKDRVAGRGRSLPETKKPGATAPSSAAAGARQRAPASPSPPKR
jgi:hypothetical protein